MRDTDKREFSEILDGMTEALGRRKIEGSGKALWWTSMVAAGVTIEEFRATLVEYLTTSTEWPSPAVIVELAGKMPQSPWPGAEEAWNMAPKTECESGWMCTETSLAMAACRDSVVRGDMIGARKAFIECYEKQPKKGEPKWWISEGGAMTYEARLEAKQALLANHPNRRPSLIGPTEHQRLTHSGSQRIGTGLQPLSGHIESSAPAKKPSKN